MELIPLIYLKNQKAVRLAGTNPGWFAEEAAALARHFEKQGASSLYINDLNVPTVGLGENIAAVKAIQKETGLKIWITGHFKSVAAIDPYAELGIEKIVLGASAYQNPHLLKEAAEKYPKAIAVMIEVKNRRVVVPGLVAPTKKTAGDYAERFREDGATAICYADDDFDGIRDFSDRSKLPVLALKEIQVLQDLQKLHAYERFGLNGVVLGKSLYEERLDLHSGIAYLNDLSAAFAREPTIKEE